MMASVNTWFQFTPGVFVALKVPFTATPVLFHVSAACGPPLPTPKAPPLKPHNTGPSTWTLPVPEVVMPARRASGNAPLLSRDAVKLVNEDPLPEKPLASTMPLVVMSATNATALPNRAIKPVPDADTFSAPSVVVPPAVTRKAGLAWAEVLELLI